MARTRALTLATIDPFGSAVRLTPSGPTSSLPRPSPSLPHQTPATPRAPVVAPQYGPPPMRAAVSQAKPVAVPSPAIPVPSAHGAPPMKADFARRLQAKAQIEKDASSKKRAIDLIRPSYTAAPKQGGPQHAKKKNKNAVVSTYTFSPQQRMVLDVVIAGQSVFFTGCAGTGKSVRFFCSFVLNL